MSSSARVCNVFDTLFIFLIILTQQYFIFQMLQVKLAITYKKETELWRQLRRARKIELITYGVQLCGFLPILIYVVQVFMLS